MKHSLTIALSVISALALLLALIVVVRSDSFYLFSAQGLIAQKESGLIILSVLLMLVVVIPVYALGLFVAWHYRASNTKALYTPDWQHSRMDELVWWVIPFEIVLILGALTWSSTHELDPSKALLATSTALTIEVVALPWKWLFIYPEQHIATVNLMEFPVDTPLDLHITADAPMNSFWIPQLGGQMYAMTGMSTTLHLLAQEPGDYAGSSANYSGAGFANMKFTARAVSKLEFNNWVGTLEQSPQVLDRALYQKLATPSEAAESMYFSYAESNLYAWILSKFNDAASPMHQH